jgi:hypothetical protein
VNAWVADAAVKAARAQLAEYAKVNSRVADMLREVLPQADDPTRQPDDATPPYEQLFLQVWEIMQAYERDHPGASEVDEALYLQKRIGEREAGNAGFARWVIQRHPRWSNAAEGALDWLAKQQK